MKLLSYKSFCHKWAKMAEGDPTILRHRLKFDGVFEIQRVENHVTGLVMQQFLGKMTELIEAELAETVA